MARFRTLLALLTLALAVPAVALAAGGNKVHIKSPHTAKLNKSFHYTASGKSSSAANKLATFINNGTKCKSTYSAQVAFNSLNEVKVSLKKGHFKQKVKVTSLAVGAHYICAYVISSAGNTLAKARSKYTTS